MDSTTSAAHRRVGAAAVLAFLALLLLGLAHNAAQADPVVPAATPAATPSVEPAQPLPRQSPVPRLDHQLADAVPEDSVPGWGAELAAAVPELEVQPPDRTLRAAPAAR